MKISPLRLCHLLGALALACSHAAFGAGPETIPVTPEHRAILDRFRSDHTAALLTATPAIIAAYLAENVRLMPEYQKTVLGRDNVSAYYEAFQSRFVVRSHRRSVLEISDLGRRIVELGTFTMTLSPRSGGAPIELDGKYLDLWEKLPDGKIALVTSAWNYLAPVAQPDDLRFSSVPAVQMALQANVPVRDSISFELAALRQLHAAAVWQRDARLWSMFYDDDALLLPNFSPIHRGRKAIDAYLAEHVLHLPVFEHLDIRNDRIDPSGDYTIEYGSHVANWRNGDSSGVNTGKAIRIWRRQPDHSLKIFRSIAMYD